MSCLVVIPYQLPNNLSSLYFLSNLLIILSNDAETGFPEKPSSGKVAFASLVEGENQ
jgi:hypothetical protein